MRRSVVVFVLAIVCAIAAIFYFDPMLGQKAGQILGLQSRPRKAAASASAGDRGVAVVLATAGTADFPIRRYAIGFLSSPAVVNVSARISSQVTAIAVKDGQMVKEGDLLFRLDDRALKAEVERDEANIAKDQALLTSAQSDMERAGKLAATQAGTAQAYDQAVAAEKAAEATLQGDQAALDADNVQLSYATITAPIAGRLGAVSVSVGDLVSTSNNNSTSTPLVTITQMDPLQVDFSLPESDLALLHKAIAAPVKGAVTLMRDGDPVPIGKGTLDFLNSNVDTASGTIATRASVPNPDLSLWPGQYVNVVLQAGTMPAMISVPTVAIQPSQKGPFVYVVKPDNKVEARPVDVALSAGANSAIGKGLSVGERVVVEGQTRLKDGAPVREVKATPASSEQTVDAGGTAGGAR